MGREFGGETNNPQIDGRTLGRDEPRMFLGFQRKEGRAM